MVCNDFRSGSIRWVFLETEYKYLLFVLAFIFHFLIFIVHGLPSFVISMSAGLVLFYFQLDKTITENFISMRLSIIEILKHEKRN